MSALNDLYQTAKNDGVGVYSYPIGFDAAVSIQDESCKAIFFDFSLLPTIKDLNWAAAHENGHLSTGAYHKLSSPYQLWQQSEHKANRWVFERYLSPEHFKEAFRAGYTEPYQLAEWFNMPELQVLKAVYYWTQTRGIDLNECVDE